MALGEASVVIKPDLSGFATEAMRQINEALRKIERRGEETAEEIERSFDELSREVTDALSSIDDGDPFAGIERDAERAGERIEDSFREAARQSDRDLSGISGGFGKAMAGIGAAIAAAGLGYLFISATHEAEAANSAIANTAQLIESTGAKAGVTQKQIMDLADALRLEIGVDDTAVIEASNVLLTFTGVTSDIFNETITRAADLQAVFGTDLSGAAIQLGKALNDPVRGITALRRSGVSFTKEQQETIKTLVETGDLASAQRLILDELAVQFGGTAAASADSTDKIGAAFDELKEAIGQGLVGALDAVTPALQTLFGSLEAPLQTLGEAFGSFLEPLISTLGPVFAEIVGVLSVVIGDVITIFEALTPLIEPIVSLVSILATTLSGALAAAFVAIAPAIEIFATFMSRIIELFAGGLSAALEAVIPALMLIGQAIADGLVAVMPDLVVIIGDFIPIVLAMLDSLLPLAPVLAEIIGTAFGLLDAFLPLVPLFGDFAMMIVERLAPFIPILADAILDLITIALPPMVALMEELVPLLLEVGQTVLAAILPVLPKFINALVVVAKAAVALLPVVGDLIMMLLEGLSPVLPIIADLLATVAVTIIDTLAPILPDLIGLVAQLLLALMPLIPPLLDIAVSLLPLIAEVIEMMLPGWTNFIELIADLAMVVVEFLVAALNEIVPILVVVYKGIAWFFDRAKPVFEAIGKVIKTVTDGMYDAFRWVFNQIAKMWNNTVGRLSFTVPDWVPGFGGKGFDVPDIPMLADGAIIRQPTLAMLGEAGEPEAVIPIARPARAYELLREAGLEGLGGGQNAPVVNIERATFMRPSDADLVAQRVLAARRVRRFAA